MMRRVVFWILGVAVALSGCDSGPNGVNGPANIAAGQTSGSVTRVNGSITVGDEAKIGSATTVNGGIEIGARATVNDINTVNGSISLAEGAKVSGSITTVNGSLTLAKGVDITGSLTNVNGDIKLDHAHVGGGIETVTADIEVGTESRVEGGILIRKNEGVSISLGTDTPRIVIGPGAVVQGTMSFGRPVKLYVSDTATIGAVEGATVEKFSGDAPPK